MEFSDLPDLPLTPKQQHRHRHELDRIERRDVEFDRLRVVLRHRLEKHHPFRAAITARRMLWLKPYSSEARRAELIVQQTAIPRRIAATCLSFVPRLARGTHDARGA